MARQVNRRDFLKLAALAPAAGAAAHWGLTNAAPAQQDTRPNVLMIVFDTLSAKHMSLYGYPRKTTPNLRRFAKRATVFHNHHSGGNFTSPATSSLLTGAYTWTQRALNFMATVDAPYESRNMFRMFHDAGYYTTTYTHNWLVAQLFDQFRPYINYWKPTRDLTLSDTELSDRLFPNDHHVSLATERNTDVGSTYGTGSLFLSMLNRVFVSNDRKALTSKYAAQFPNGLPTNQETIQFVNEDAMNWIQSEVGQAPHPFFGYFHLLPPHEPYRPRKEFVGMFKGDKYVEVPKPIHPLGTKFDEDSETTTRRNYDEFLAYADAEFGRLYDNLVKANLLDNTYVIFTADHGQILERGTKGHWNPLLYEPITRIPLMISAPGQTERVNVNTPTSCLDVLPTLANIIGQPKPDWAEGELLPTFGGQKPDSDRGVITIEAKSNAKQAPLTLATLAMVKNDYKLIHYLGYGKGYDNHFEMYNLKDDPEELTDLYGTQKETASELQAELLAKLDAANKPYERG